VDDIICVLLGCIVPLVLREKEASREDMVELPGDSEPGKNFLLLRPGQKQHAVIGECFVVGMMEGEIVGKLNDGKHVLESFALR
jgi:hypothetical protein